MAWSGDPGCDQAFGYRECNTEAAEGRPGDCQEWGCDVDADGDGLTLPDGSDGWYGSNRNCISTCVSSQKVVATAGDSSFRGARVTS